MEEANLIKKTLSETELALLEIMEQAGFTEEEMQGTLGLHYELGTEEEILNRLLQEELPISKARYESITSEVELPIVKRLHSQGRL